MADEITGEINEIPTQEPDRQVSETNRGKTAGTGSDKSDGMAELMAKRRISGVDRIGKKHHSSE